MLPEEENIMRKKRLMRTQQCSSKGRSREKRQGRICSAWEAALNMFSKEEGSLESALDVSSSDTKLKQSL